MGNYYESEQMVLNCTNDVRTAVLPSGIIRLTPMKDGMVKLEMTAGQGELTRKDMYKLAEALRLAADKARKDAL